MNVEGCRRLICYAIQLAALSAYAGDPAGVRYFREEKSPFWEDAAHVGLDARLLSNEVLFNVEMQQRPRKAKSRHTR